MANEDSIPLANFSTATPTNFLREDERRAPSPHDVEDIFPQSTSLDSNAYALARDDIPQWKRDLYALLEQPTSSAGAFTIHMFMTALIVLSAVLTVAETVPAFHSINPRVWFGFETSLVALFTVEYIARFTSWSGSWTTLFHWTFCESTSRI